MPTLRYVKTPEQIERARSSNPEFTDSTVRSVRCVYRTDLAIARALVPQPLVVDESAEICVTFSNVAIHITPEYTFEIGSGIFGVKASYEGVEGIYLVTMPMTTEQAVVPGRETFGEPKKIAEIAFTREGDSVASSVSRMGMTYLSVEGTVGAALGSREFTEYGYCVKALPACDQGRDFDGDPLLVRLEWKHKQTGAWTLDGTKLTLGESPFDPVADVPVRELLRAEYEEGSTQSN
ncbi:MAG: acetoacetate decarboxylase, partial [Hyphomicrobiaceae bacterium]